MQAFRKAIRRLARDPIFTATGLVSLSVGIGASVAMLTATYELLWKPLPYPDRDRLVAIFETTPQGARSGVALANFLDFEAQSESFASMAAYRRRSFGLTAPDDDLPVMVVQVGTTTSSILEVLGETPSLGRAFTETEERTGEPVIVLTHELWSERFGADRDLVGRAVLLNDVSHTVVGILPSGFTFPIAGGRSPIGGGGHYVEAFVPIPHRDFGNKRAVRTLGVVAQLHEGVSMEEGRTELKTIAERLASNYPDTNGDFGVATIDLHEALTGENRQPLLLLTAACLLALLIVCANLANLLLARTFGRARELAVQMAMGASRRRIASDFAVEGLVLGVAGASAGFAIAYASLLGLPRALPLIGGYTSEALSLALAHVGLVVPLISIVVVAFAFAPSVVVREGGLSHTIRTGTLASRGGTRLRRVLVIVQIALGLVLLRGTGLLARSFDALMSVDPGFEADEILTFGLGLPEGRYDTERKMLAFHRKLIGEIESIPGVTAAGAAVWLPLSGPSGRASFLPASQNAPRNEWPSADVKILTPGALETLRIPLLEGRPFTWRDDLDAPRVLLVSHAFQRMHFRDRSPLGERVAVSWRSPSTPEGTIWEIVGVIGDTRQSLGQEPVPEIAFPVGQFPPEGISYVIRSGRLDPDLTASIRAAVSAIDADLQQIRIRAMHDRIAESVSDRRLSLALTSALSATALALAAMGVFGVLAFMVSQRRRELAIRMALGATRTDVRRLILGECAKLTLGGVAVSLLGFAYVAALLRSQLYGVDASDTTALAVSVATFLVVAFLAAFVPSERAVRTEPINALREE